MARKSSDASYRNYTARVHLNAINNTHCIVPSGRYVFLSMPYACVCARTTTRLQWAPNWACSFSSSASQLLTILLSFFLFSKRRLHLLFDARPNEICRLFCHPFELYIRRFQRIGGFEIQFCNFALSHLEKSNFDFNKPLIF